MLHGLSIEFLSGAVSTFMSLRLDIILASSGILEPSQNLFLSGREIFGRVVFGWP